MNPRHHVSSLTILPKWIAAAIGFVAASSVMASGVEVQPKSRPSLTAPPTAEGETIALTLPEAVALGLRQNRAIQSAYLQRIAQKFDLHVAESQFYPKLTVSGSFLGQRNGGTDGSAFDANPVATEVSPLGTQVNLGWQSTVVYTGGVGRTSSSSLSLGVIQPLLKNAGLDVNMAPIRIARLTEKLNKLTLKTTVSQTVTAIITAYRALLQAQEQLRVNQDALARNRDLLALNKDLIKSGRMANVEIVQTEASVANQELATEQSVNGVDTARLALLDTLAIDPRANIVTTEPVAAQQVRVDLDKALETAFDNQPTYLAQLVQVETAKLTLLVAKNQRLWDVSIVAGTSISHQSPSDTVTELTANGPTTSSVAIPNRSSYAGLQLTVPLGDLTPEQGEVKADVAVRTAELQLQDIHQQVEHQTRDAVRNVDATWRQYEIAHRARDLAARAVEIEREKLQAGRSSNFQVLSLETDLRAAESNQSTAEITYLNALTILDQQLGTTLDTWKIWLED